MLAGCALDELIARVFDDAEGQYVRVPAEFRMATDRVRVTRNDAGDLVLHPVPVRRGAASMPALRALGLADEAFVAALHAHRDGSTRVQERETL